MCTMLCESCLKACVGVIVTCFVASVMLSLLINVYLYIAIIKRVVLIFVNALYKTPLLL